MNKRIDDRTDIVNKVEMGQANFSRLFIYCDIRHHGLKRINIRFMSNELTESL